MSSIALVVAVAATLLNPVQDRSTPSIDPTTDDALVLRAVLEHTILPRVRQSSEGRAGDFVALLKERSTPLCTNPPRNGTCRIPDPWRPFLVPNDRQWPGLVENERRRNELVASLEARNTSTHALPAIDLPAIILIPADRVAEMRQRYRQQTVGSSSLSMPGYSSDGYAFVYGGYGCGSRCGLSWLFVLRKVDGVWRVESSAVTAVS